MAASTDITSRLRTRIPSDARATIHSEDAIFEKLAPVSSGRRGFLKSLAALPLIGGGLTLIGQPTAVAEPITAPLLATYEAWLVFEHRRVIAELAGRPEVVARYRGARGDRGGLLRLDNPAGSFHCLTMDRPPSTRAALVLSAVGCGWREG